MNHIKKKIKKTGKLIKVPGILLVSIKTLRWHPETFFLRCRALYGAVHIHFGHGRLLLAGHIHNNNITR